MAESIQHKLSRIRPPRVHITYDVETGGAIVKKELAFLVGVISDLSGRPEKPLPLFNARRFVEIDRDNFNQVLESMKPRLAFRVKNTLRGEGADTELSVDLKFKHIDDFEPTQVAKKVEVLAKLLEARQRLVDLSSKLDGNAPLEELLLDITQDKSKLEELKKLTAKEAGSTEAKSATTNKTKKGKK